MLKKISHSRDNSIENGHRRKSSSHAKTPPVSGSSNATHKRNTSRSSISSVSSNFLAEQYDRDRSGLIKSCFQKSDPKTGMALSSYITHVRIIEDARYPSSRPPASSSLENKKKRILIISSQGNGKGMQLHKARENSNGTFQIGRTWNLIELESIERDDEIAQGFTIMMGKKYYWETNSAKERTVFIKSLVSIFMENSRGRVPVLINWDLSLFYLDQRSYERAVLQKKPASGSVSKTSTATQSLQLQNTQPQVGSATIVTPTAIQSSSEKVPQPQHEQIEEQRASISPKKLELKPSSPVRSYSPKRPSISSAPYSQSTTINDVEKKLTATSLTSEKPIMVLTEAIPYSEQISSVPSALNETQPSASTDLDLDVDTDTRNVLEEIDGMLNSPLDAVNIRPRRSSYHDIEQLMDNDSKVAKEDAAHIGSEEDSDDDIYHDITEDYGAEAESSLPEQSGDLSFENGDEVRYGQKFDAQVIPSANEYRHVHTIPEEQSELIDTTRGEFAPDIADETRPESPAANLEEAIDEAVLIEVLSEVNWAVDDNSSSLLEKLHSRLADVEYQFNKSLLALPKSLDELNPYRNELLKQCDKIDPNLSFFTMELASVSNDVDYVESQQNGLQVRISNKKRLWYELSEILHSVSVDSQSLQELLRLPISKTSIDRMDQLLSDLYVALKAIDGGNDEYFNDSEDNLGGMRALSERRNAYEKVSALFIENTVDQLSSKLKEIEKSSDGTTDGLSSLLVFASLSLFCKDISMESYDRILQLWNESAVKLYDRKVNMLIARLRPVNVQGSQQSQLNFSEDDRALLYKWWCSLRIERNAVKEKPSLDTSFASTVTVVKEMKAICVVYQNFVSNFFHLASGLKFDEFVEKIPPADRSLIKLDEIGSMESVRMIAVKKNNLVSKVLQNQLTKFFNFIVMNSTNNRMNDPSLLFFLEYQIKLLESTDQEVLRNNMLTTYQRLIQDWTAHVDEECIYIERASVNFKTRSILSYVIGFPIFIRNIESNLEATANWLGIKDHQSYDFRKYVESAYYKLGQSVVKLFTSSIHQRHSGDSIENINSVDRLDESITLLINANLLLETVTLLDMEVLSPIVQDVKKAFESERDKYSDMLLHSNMRNLLAFVHGASSLVDSSSERRVVDPKKWAAYSEENLRKILTSYTSREITVLIDTLYSNMSSHFLNETSNEVRKVLCQKLWSNIQGETVSFYLKLYSLIEKHYKGVALGFSKKDIITAFEMHK